MSEFDRVNKEITDDLKHELRLQGHYLTGELERSIKEKQIVGNDVIVLTAEAAGYLETLEEYTSPDKITLTNDEFDKLKKWVILRGMATSEFEAGQIATAIYYKWMKEGRPTKDSVAFSSTGKRIEALKDAFQSNEARYGSMIDDVVVDELDDEFLKPKSGIV